MQPGFEKRFTSGDIVYFCNRSDNGLHVTFGMVDEQFSDVVCIDLLELKERRKINGVPINETPPVGKWHKLPKGWAYDTELITITWDNFDFLKKPFDITNPKVIKDAYKKGYLVKSNTIFHGDIDTEITENGWRIVLKYPQYKHHQTRVSIRPDKVYFTYEEAEKKVVAYEKELTRISELSDYEWSVEQIEKTLKRDISLTEENREKYKDWLLALDNVEDIETRIYGGTFQWKYEKNKRWNNIVL